MRITYYRDLYSNLHFSLSLVAPLIRKAVEVGKFCYTAEAITKNDYSLRFSFDPSTMELTIKCKEGDGEEFEQKVKVIAEKSNLPSLSGSKVYYFICPRQGVKCRKLFKIGSYFWSRRAFKASYPNQRESRNNREIAFVEDPTRKGGKEYYRGKLTPYGRRLQRYDERTDAQLAAMQRVFKL